MTSTQTDQAVQLYTDSLPLSAVGERLGHTKTTVLRVLRRRGVATRDGDAPATCGQLDHWSPSNVGTP